MSIAKHVLELIEKNNGNLILPKGVSGVFHTYHTKDTGVSGSYIAFKDGSELALGQKITVFSSSYSDAGEITKERLDSLFDKEKDFNLNVNC